MKSIIHYGKKEKLLHVETPLGIVNIYVKLTDIEGRETERIDYIPNRYVGELKVHVHKDIRTILAKQDLA